MKNRKTLSIWLPLLISLSMVGGMFVGFKLRDGMPGIPFFHTEKQRPIRELLELVNRNYVDTVNINELTDTAINAMLTKLDPHSVFIPASDVDDVNADIKGSFSGIGIEFNLFNDTMHVMHAIEDGPAFKAGIVRGDRVILANGKPVSGQKLSLEQIRNMMRGETGSEITLTIIRNGQRIEKTLTRGMIPVSSVDASFMIADSTGYIRLNKFSSQTYREFMTQLDALTQKGISKLILDLRDNGGGVLEEAIEIADEFLSGDKLITYTEGRAFPRKEFRCRREGLFEKGKLVVLADEMSASASEVLIGALQDWDRATIMGRRTFGKGLVQEQYSLSDGSALRLTIARYYTPSGRSIQRPYNQGEKAYFDEINQRADHDSSQTIKTNADTGRQYKTMAGRIVYGGGGITPDIYVPSDTTRSDSNLVRVIRGSIPNSAAYRILLNNPSVDKQFKSPDAFVRSYSISQSDWETLTALASKDSISLSSLKPNDIAYLQLTLKASIARLIWRNEGYFEVYSQSDKAIQKALEWLKK